MSHLDPSAVLPQPKLFVCVYCLVTLSVVSSPDSVQVSRGFLPVQHPGQLLLVAGGGHVSADPAGSDVCLAEEILLVVHLDWMG